MNIACKKTKITDSSLPMKLLFWLLFSVNVFASGGVGSFGINDKDVTVSSSVMNDEANAAKLINPSLMDNDFDWEEYSPDELEPAPAGMKLLPWQESYAGEYGGSLSWVNAVNATALPYGVLQSLRVRKDGSYSGVVQGRFFRFPIKGKFSAATNTATYEEGGEKKFTGNASLLAFAMMPDGRITIVGGVYHNSRHYAYLFAEKCGGNSLAVSGKHTVLLHPSADEVSNFSGNASATFSVSHNAYARMKFVFPDNKKLTCSARFTATLFLPFYAERQSAKNFSKGKFSSYNIAGNLRAKVDDPAGLWSGMSFYDGYDFFLKDGLIEERQSYSEARMIGDRYHLWSKNPTKVNVKIVSLVDDTDSFQGSTTEVIEADFIHGFAKSERVNLKIDRNGLVQGYVILADDTKAMVNGVGLAAQNLWAGFYKTDAIEGYVFLE